MQWIKLVPEDGGIQNLKADNKRPAITRNVDAVSPYPSVHAPRIGEDALREARKHQKRRTGDRREGNDRRKQQTRVLLDTRSKHDRRAIGDRRSADPDPDADTNDATDQPPSKHLNIYA